MSWCDQRVIIDRPNVQCAFDVMDRCNAYFAGEEAAACREGARDAHLLSGAYVEPSTDREARAYAAGYYTTFEDCVPRQC